MLPWELIERAEVPGGARPLELYRRGQEWSIRIGGQELMNSRQHGSEQALAELACAPIAKRERPALLIGGLGMGFTLRAALADVPAVVAWNRGPLAALAGQPLHDRRVRVEQGDVAALIAAVRARYDAIVLDVDNGPAGLTRAGNDGLYGNAGLRAAFDALRPGGVLAVWSAARAPAFNDRLRRTGFTLHEHSARARGSHGGAHHTLWIAIKPAGREKPAR